GAATERLAHRNEFGPPALIGAEIARKRIPQGWIRFALITETVKKQLMKNHGIHRDELLPLQPVDQESGRARVIEAGKLFLNEVQPLHRPAVIVLVVADDHAFRHAAHTARI